MSERLNFICDGTFKPAAGPGWFAVSHTSSQGPIRIDFVDAGAIDEAPDGHAVPHSHIQHGEVATGMRLVIRGPVGLKVSVTCDAAP